MFKYAYHRQRYRYRQRSSSTEWWLGFTAIECSQRNSVTQSRKTEYTRNSIIMADGFQLRLCAKMESMAKFVHAVYDTCRVLRTWVHKAEMLLSSCGVRECVCVCLRSRIVAARMIRNKCSERFEERKTLPFEAKDATWIIIIWNTIDVPFMRCLRFR